MTLAALMSWGGVNTVTLRRARALRRVRKPTSCNGFSRAFEMMQYSVFARPNERRNFEVNFGE